MQKGVSEATVRPVTLAVAGAGNWGQQWIRVCNGLDRARLVAVCDPDASRAALVPRQCRHAAWYETLDAMLERSAVDALVVATPTILHAELALRALDVGCHVLVEKPLAHDAQHARRVAAHRGARVMAGHLLRYHPAIERILEMVRRGALGAVTHVLCDRMGARTRSHDDSAWWGLAPHDISVMRLVFGGEPQSVHCTSRAPSGDRPEDSVTGLLEFSGGGLGVVRVGRIGHKKVRRITVVGERRSVTFADGHLMSSLAYYDSVPQGLDHPEGVSFATSPVRKDEIVGIEPLKVEGQHFVDCLRSGAPFASDVDEGVAVVDVLEAGSRSLKTGAVVHLRPPTRTELGPAVRRDSDG